MGIMRSTNHGPATNTHPLLSSKSFQGFYSKITETDKYIIKSISCSKKLMSWSEAENLKEHISTYKKELNLLKIPNPQLVSCQIENITKDKYSVILKEEKIKGDTIAELATNEKVSDNQCLKYFDQILKYYINVIAGGRKISLDPPLSNFILGYNSKGLNNIYYIDSMPPRQRTLSNWIVEYPGPKKLSIQNYHYKRHFTDSQFQVIYVQMCKGRISLRKSLTDIFIKNFSKVVLKHIRTPSTAPTIFNLLNSCNIKDVDYIRNITLELLFLNVISKTEFENIYRQTHIQEGSGDLPTKDGLANLNIFLLNKLKNT